MGNSRTARRRMSQQGNRGRWKRHQRMITRRRAREAEAKREGVNMRELSKLGELTEIAGNRKLKKDKLGWAQRFRSHGDDCVCHDCKPPTMRVS